MYTVVRPNHYLQQGTFSKEQHLLPNSFFTPGQQVEAELRNLNVAGSTGEQSQVKQVVQEQAGSENVAITSSAESAPDSYANIGGVSGKIASSIHNTNEYGETVPQAFSNLDKDSYAYYHGHKAQN